MRLSKTLKVLILTLYALPVIYGYFFIFNYSVNVIYWDQWDTIVIWTLKWFKGEFGLEELFGLYNDSRLTFPILLIMFSTLVTSMNVKIMYFVGFTFYLFCILLLLYFIKTDIGFNNRTLFLFIPLMYYALNPYYLARYIQNLGAITSPILVFAAVSTIYFLYRAKNSFTHLSYAILTGFICSFSGAYGLTIWFAGITQLFLQKMSDRLKKIFIWIASAAIVFFTHFVLLGTRVESVRHGAEAYQIYLKTALYYPIHKFLCFMGVIGAEIIVEKYTALYFGLLILFVFVFILYVNRKNLNTDRYAKWFALLVFGVLTSLELALTRSGDIAKIFGPPDNICFNPDPRHQTAVFLPIICLYVLAIAYIKNSSNDSTPEPLKEKPIKRKKVINVFITIILLMLLIGSSILHFHPGMEVAEERSLAREMGAYVLATYSIQSDENIKKYLHPVPANVRERARFLEKNKLNIFSKPAGNISHLKLIRSDTHFSMDTINGKRVSQQTMPFIINQSREETVTINGWAVDKEANNIASAVFITIDGRIDVPTLYGLDRPDVANHFKNPDIRFSGYTATFSSSILSKGEHTISLKIVGEDGIHYYHPEQVLYLIVN